MAVVTASARPKEVPPKEEPKAAAEPEVKSSLFHPVRYVCIYMYVFSALSVNTSMSGFYVIFRADEGYETKGQPPYDWPPIAEPRKEQQGPECILDTNST